MRSLLWGREVGGRSESPSLDRSIGHRRQARALTRQGWPGRGSTRTQVPRRVDAPSIQQRDPHDPWLRVPNPDPPPIGRGPPARACDEGSNRRAVSDQHDLPDIAASGAPVERTSGRSENPVQQRSMPFPARRSSEPLSPRPGLIAEARLCLLPGQRGQLAEVLFGKPFINCNESLGESQRGSLTSAAQRGADHCGDRVTTQSRAGARCEDAPPIRAAEVDPRTQQHSRRRRRFAVSQQDQPPSRLRSQCRLVAAHVAAMRATWSAATTLAREPGSSKRASRRV